mmetsp:Transcript_605/g.1486  ORF Transcript_605/g.1486 Transcript_605/m.1486 type:complete len:205 (+) Transcript_605:149-763(+)
MPRSVQEVRKSCPTNLAACSNRTTKLSSARFPSTLHCCQRAYRIAPQIKYPCPPDIHFIWLSRTNAPSTQTLSASKSAARPLYGSCSVGDRSMDVASIALSGSNVCACSRLKSTYLMRSCTRTPKHSRHSRQSARTSSRLYGGGVLPLTIKTSLTASTGGRLRTTDVTPALHTRCRLTTSSCPINGLLPRACGSSRAYCSGSTG